MICILVSETEEALRILLSQELEEEGYEVVAIPPERLKGQLAAKNPSLVLLSSQDLSDRQISFLKEMDIPFLTYGPLPLRLARTVRLKSSGIAVEEFNLRRIKGKIRELLGRSSSPSSTEPGTDPPPMPSVQMHFAFSWSTE